GGKAEAQQRAARERQERLQQALARLPELEAKKKANEMGQARCSSTDPEATVREMADGGFRPAYNFQYTTDTAGQAVVGVEVITAGSDAGQPRPVRLKTLIHEPGEAVRFFSPLPSGE